MPSTRPGPTPVPVSDGGFSAKELPSAPVTRVVAMWLGELAVIPVLNWRLSSQSAWLGTPVASVEV